MPNMAPMDCKRAVGKSGSDAQCCCDWHKGCPAPTFFGTPAAAYIACPACRVIASIEAVGHRVRNEASR